MIWTETVFDEVKQQNHTFIINVMLWSECNHFTIFVKEIKTDATVKPICSCFSFRYDTINGALSINFKDAGVRHAFLLLSDAIFATQDQWSKEIVSERAH